MRSFWLLIRLEESILGDLLLWKTVPDDLKRGQNISVKPHVLTLSTRNATWQCGTLTPTRLSKHAHLSTTTMCFSILQFKTLLNMRTFLQQYVFHAAVHTHSLLERLRSFIHDTKLHSIMFNCGTIRVCCLAFTQLHNNTIRMSSSYHCHHCFNQR